MQTYIDNNRPIALSKPPSLPSLLRTGPCTSERSCTTGAISRYRLHNGKRSAKLYGILGPIAILIGAFLLISPCKTLALFSSTDLGQRSWNAIGAEVAFSNASRSNLAVSIASEFEMDALNEIPATAPVSICSRLTVHPASSNVASIADAMRCVSRSCEYTHRSKSSGEMCDNDILNCSQSTFRHALCFSKSSCALAARSFASAARSLASAARRLATADSLVACATWRPNSAISSLSKEARLLLANISKMPSQSSAAMLATTTSPKTLCSFPFGTGSGAIAVEPGAVVDGVESTPVAFSPITPITSTRTQTDVKSSSPKIRRSSLSFGVLIENENVLLIVGAAFFAIVIIGSGRSRR
jgi:hypothetical protein